jgi:undecaprenyl diphosphate synthase
MSKKTRILPKHVALIPDGNRRWSRNHRLALLQGYNLGIKKFVDFSEWLKQFGVSTLSVWALSTENVINRNAAELRILYDLYVKAANDPEIIARLIKNRARIRIVGNLSLLPERVRKALKSLETKTRNYRDYTINMLVAYGGRDDITYALRRIAATKAHNPSRISEKLISENLRSSRVPNVDMVIRTSGEERVSGLLPWQAGYSELYFARKYWPDFQKKDLKRALDTFSKRRRRFGK